jgi:hypothetical protein
MLYTQYGGMDSPTPVDISDPLVAVQPGESVVPESELAAARAHARQEDDGSANPARSGRGSARKKWIARLHLLDKEG